MGAETFTNLIAGTDVQDAFVRGTEEAAHEHGHGGYTGSLAEKGEYTIITHTPLVEVEAYALASRLIDANDPRIDDKWGPAGAIPVVSDTRKVPVKGFEYVHDHDFREWDKVQPGLLEAITPLVRLRRGETIKSVQLSSYETPQRNYSGYGGLRPVRKSTYKNCQGTVTINKAPSIRKATVVIEIPGGLDYDQREKEIAKQVSVVTKVRAGERVIDWQAGQDTPGAARVTAVAPKGATETRFVAVTKDRFGHSGLDSRLGHGTWEDGFTSQAEARAWLTDVASNEKNWVDFGPLSHLGDEVTLEIESITRRADGQPLVAVTRRVGKRTVQVEVTIKLAGAGEQATPDAWLFFGWASS